MLTFAAAPDFEAAGDVGTNNDYDVQITVTDAGSLTDIQDIVITVQNVNEAPSIDSPATADVNENQTSAIDVQATDDSDSEGSGLTYSKTGGADEALFNLDSATGVLTFIAIPDFEMPADAGLDNVYNIQVTVTDSGLLATPQDIAITVMDANDAPIIPTTTTSEATVFENGRLDINIETTDDTDSEGSGLTYSISGPDAGFFTIDEDTGELTFIGPSFLPPADADGDNIFIVDVTVTDQGGLTAMLNIMISLKSLQDIPIFTPFGLLFVIMGLFFIGRRKGLIKLKS